MNLEGGCACRAIRYRLTASPLIVHACHCRDCQRLTGGPFVINLWIEGRFVEPGPVAPRSVQLAGGTGKRHDVYFCEMCGTTLWSRYHIVPGDCLLVRAGRDARHAGGGEAGRSHLHAQQIAVAGPAGGRAGIPIEL